MGEVLTIDVRDAVDPAVAEEKQNAIELLYQNNHISNSSLRFLHLLRVHLVFEL